MTHFYTNIFGHYGTQAQHSQRARDNTYRFPPGQSPVPSYSFAPAGSTNAYPTSPQRHSVARNERSAQLPRQTVNYGAVEDEKQVLLQRERRDESGCLSLCKPSFSVKAHDIEVGIFEKNRPNNDRPKAEFDFPPDVRWYEAYVRTTLSGHNGESAKDWFTPAILQCAENGLGVAPLILRNKELAFAKPNDELMQRKPRNFAVCHVPVPFKLDSTGGKNIVIALVDLQSVGTGFGGYGYVPGYYFYNMPRLVGFTSVCIYVPAVPPPLIGTFMVLIPVVPFGNESSVVQSRRVIKLHDKPQYVILDSPTYSPFMIAYYTDKLEAS